MYLLLTGAVSALQMFAEVMLDLDRPSPRERLRRLLPGRRATTLNAPASTKADAEEPAPAIGQPVTAAQWAARATALSDNAIAVNVHDLHKHYGANPVLGGVDLSIRTG